MVSFIYVFHIRIHTHVYMSVCMCTHVCKCIYRRRCTEANNRIQPLPFSNTSVPSRLLSSRSNPYRFFVKYIRSKWKRIDQKRHYRISVKYTLPLHYNQGRRPSPPPLESKVIRGSTEEKGEKSKTPSEPGFFGPTHTKNMIGRVFILYKGKELCDPIASIKVRNSKDTFYNE